MASQTMGFDNAINCGQGLLMTYIREHGFYYSSTVKCGFRSAVCGFGSSKRSGLIKLGGPGTNVNPCFTSKYISKQ